MAERKMLKQVVTGKYPKLYFQQERASYECTNEQIAGLREGKIYDVTFRFKEVKNPKNGETWNQKVIVSIEPMAAQAGPIEPPPAPAYAGRFADKENESMSELPAKDITPQQASIAFCNALNNSVQMTMAFASACTTFKDFAELTVDQMEGLLIKFQQEQFERFKKEHGLV